MRKLSNLYHSYKEKRLGIKYSSSPRFMSRRGYGYIKRRVGLLSSEVDGPICVIRQNPEVK